VEYQNEGYTMFDTMKEGIKEESVGSLFNLQVQVQESPIVEQPPLAADGALAAPGTAAAAGAGARPATAGATRGATGGTAGGAAGGTAPQPGSAGGRAGRGRGTPAAAGAGAPEAPAVPAGLARGLDAPRRPGRLQYTAPSADTPGQAEMHTETGNGTSGDFSRVGRNAPCPCGSGKKFKQCHGDPRNR
jgi:preprotein translocase subunit SecA